PMDPNYQRDEPGKSPMGMDLIPVYASEAGGVDEGIGTIRISPDVVNNLGVRTSPVERRELNAEITTVGYVQYDEDQLIHVHPRVEGWVETLFVKAEGDPIEAGEPLYQLYSPPLVNAQEELLLAIGRGNPRLIEAAEERLKALQIDDKVIDEIKRAGSVQQQITFYSPMSGVVDNLNIREGFYVQPGTTLLSIGSLDQVWVEAEVFERQAALVELGLPVSMTLDYLPGREWQGEVDYIYPSLDNKSRTLRVRLRFDNADGLLKPNMYAQVVIQVALDAPVLAVPRDAVIRTGNQNRLVLALGEGYYKSIAVDLGRVTQEYVEILNGVEEGEAVVTSAQFLLDSESSKTSDFKRLHHGDSDTEISAESNVVTNDGNTNSHDDNMSDMVGDEDAETVWVEAEIKSVTPETRVLSAEHEPVPQWQWPSMTMNFFVAEEVDFNQLQAGTQLHMQIGMRADGQYEISAVHIMSQPPFNDQPSMDAEGSLPAEGSEMTDHSQHQMMHNE
ncbi:MAG: efflux RND transporter periplasmic adaptor subunit, partial [Paracoccaceae bacterium]|nr:efflux RND transporter periplasmic adaptor subunit [Paracoccaceae bacterium]